MNSFYMNGRLWRVQYVDPYDPMLIDRTGEQRVATTDPHAQMIYILKSLQGDFLQRVLCHELGHAAMISYNMLDEIHRMVKPRYWIEMEEWICNFLADYGLSIFKVAYSLLGDDAWNVIPCELEKLFSKGE